MKLLEAAALAGTQGRGRLGGNGSPAHPAQPASCPTRGCTFPKEFPPGPSFGSCQQSCAQFPPRGVAPEVGTTPTHHPSPLPSETGRCP